MDARALLTAQGWRGDGHSLHPTSDGHGLTHHILIKRNDDGRGLGSKKDHKAEAWWLNAFDQALKGIDTKGSGGGLRQTLRDGALQKIAGRGAADKYTGSRGLYACFVPGGTLNGTVGQLVTPPDSGAETKEGEGKRRVKKEKKAKSDDKKISRSSKTASSSPSSSKKDVEKDLRKTSQKSESKEERRARKEARRLMRAEKEEKKKTKVSKADRKMPDITTPPATAQQPAKSSKSKSQRMKDATTAKSSNSGLIDEAKIKKRRKESKTEMKESAGGDDSGKTRAEETREERRARRDARRKRKDERRKLQAIGA